LEWIHPFERWKREGCPVQEFLSDVRVEFQQSSGEIGWTGDARVLRGAILDGSARPNAPLASFGSGRVIAGEGKPHWRRGAQDFGFDLLGLIGFVSRVPSRRAPECAIWVRFALLLRRDQMWDGARLNVPLALFCSFARAGRSGSSFRQRPASGKARA
jgi:hypothetical protein